MRTVQSLTDAMAWARNIKGVLLDVTGVLYNSGPSGGTVIEGSVQAIRRFVFIHPVSEFTRLIQYCIIRLLYY